MAAVGFVLFMALAAAVKVSGLTTDHSECMGCICLAVSGCDIHRDCLGDGCGPFHVTRDQWIAAGSPVQHRDHPHENRAFERCVLEPFCAAETVRSYTNKYAKDCDGDGKITCMDLFMVHVLGRNCSSRLLNDKDKTNMMACLKENERNVNPTLEKNKTAPVSSTPTQTTLKSTYATTPSTKPSTKPMFTTPKSIYPTKQTTSQLQPGRPVSTAKPYTVPTRFVYPTKMTSKSVYTTPQYRATTKTTPRPTGGTQRASTSVRAPISNNTIVEVPVVLHNQTK